MTDIEYWNKVAKNCSSMENKSITDNFKKRQVMLRELLAYDFDDESILEIGVGAGVIAGIIKILYPKVKYKATDLSDYFVATAKKFFNVDAIQARITELPFSDKSFSNIFLFDVLEHIKKDELEKAYSEIDRVLADKGVVFVNNPLSPTHHDLNFDFPYSDIEVGTLAVRLGGRIEMIKVIGTGTCFYQFIVISRLRG